jgi:regulator of protease activity HflC (stomatin/prohibitin superfamily)
MSRFSVSLSSLMVLFLLAMAVTGCATVEPGNIGVKVCLGSVENETLQPGTYGMVFCHVDELSTRTQTYTMAGEGQETAVNGSVRILTRDQLSVNVDVSVQFHLNERQVLPVYKVFGSGYDHTIVHPLVRTAVRDAASEFTAVQLIDERARLQSRMNELVRSALANTLHTRNVSTEAILVDNILLRNIDLPASLDQAIANVQRQRQETMQQTQARQTAEQRALSLQAQARGESEAMLIRMRADMEAARMRAERTAENNRLLTASLTPEILRLRQIEAMNAMLSSNQTRVVFLSPGQPPPVMMMPAVGVGSGTP